MYISQSKQSFTQHHEYHNGQQCSSELGLQRNFFPIRPEPDFAGFGMTNPARAGVGLSN